MIAASGAAVPLAHEPLRKWEKWGLYGLLLVVIGFGVMTELRSAFYKTRMTDLGCYLRAGWAVVAGEDIFEVMDDNYWHFAYTPVFAVAMAPLADAPAGYPRDGEIPYPVTVAIWYVFGVVCTFLAIHWVAGALEEISSDPLIRTLPMGCRLWWHNRIIALLVCAVPIGGTLQRGQVNMLVVLLVAGMFRATVRQRRFASGLWLTAAICVKIIPAFLILFPLWRRDYRALAGLAVGMFLSLFVIPVAVWGVAGSMALHEKLATDILFPGALGNGHAKRNDELLKMTTTANHSIKAAAHNIQYWNITPRPPWASKQTKVIHLILSILVTAACLWCHGWRRTDDPMRNLLFLSALLAAMLACSPISHPHYFCFLAPMIIALQFIDQEKCSRYVGGSRRLTIAFVATCAIFILTDLPIWGPRQQAGLDLVSVIILLPIGLHHLRKSARRVTESPAQAAQAMAAAA